METNQTSFADTKRAEIRAQASSIGIDEAYLSDLVEQFYARLRADERLGPIFEKRIGANWDLHLARMKDFWASVALNSGGYSGKPVPKHQKLHEVAREDFGHWLEVFKQTLDDTAASQDAVDYLMLRARRIAASLEMAMFDRAGTGPEAPPSLR